MKSLVASCQAAIFVVVVLTTCASFIAVPAALFFSNNKTSGGGLINTTAGLCQNNQHRIVTSLCYSFIVDYEKCLGIYQWNKTYISQSSSFTAADLEFASIMSALRPKAVCRTALVPFLCLYSFPHCDNSGTILYPDAGYCEDVSSVACKEEWEEAAVIGTESTLPKCDILPLDSSTLNTRCISELINSAANSTALDAYDNSTAHVQCGEGLYLYNDTCRPRCDSWETTGGVRLKIVSIVSAAIGFVSNVVFIFAALVRRKIMLSFPKVLVVYMVLDILILTTFHFINYSDRGALFCTSPDLISSIIQPSAFCSISGSVLVYQNLQVAVLWVCHVSMLFFKLIFPFRARLLDVSGHTKYVHAVYIAVSVLVPIVPVAVTFATDGFAMGAFPPFFCFSKNRTALYYSLVLPISVLLAIGTAMLTAVIWSVRKHHGLLRERRTADRSPLPPVSDAERKLLLTAIYYIVVGVTTTVSMSISLRNVENVRLKLAEYFLCIRGGEIAASICQHYKDEVDVLINVDLIAASLGLTYLFPVIHLFYAFSISKWCKRRRTAKQLRTTVSLEALKTAKI